MAAQLESSRKQSGLQDEHGTVTSSSHKPPSGKDILSQNGLLIEQGQSIRAEAIKVSIPRSINTPPNQTYVLPTLAQVSCRKPNVPHKKLGLFNATDHTIPPTPDRVADQQSLQ